MKGRKEGKNGGEFKYLRNFPIPPFHPLILPSSLFLPSFRPSALLGFFGEAPQRDG
jgi:hypothetical protein